MVSIEQQTGESEAALIAAGVREIVDRFTSEYNIGSNVRSIRLVTDKGSATYNRDPETDAQSLFLNIGTQWGKVSLGGEKVAGADWADHNGEKINGSALNPTSEIDALSRVSKMTEAFASQTPTPTHTQ